MCDPYGIECPLWLFIYYKHWNPSDSVFDAFIKATPYIGF